jgi:hypothetical protein
VIYLATIDFARIPCICSHVPTNWTNLIYPLKGAVPASIDRRDLLPRAKVKLESAMDLDWKADCMCLPIAAWRKIFRPRNVSLLLSPREISSYVVANFGLTDI